MTTLREAAQQALEALESAVEYDYHGIPLTETHAEFNDAINALLSALAEPVMEPYAWMAVGGTIWRHKTSEDDVPLYTAPFQRKPLTEQEIWHTYKNLWMFHPAEEPRLAGDVLKFARAIERAHGIV